MGLDFVAQDTKRTRQAVLELVPLIKASSMPNCISHKFSHTRISYYPHTNQKSGCCFDYHYFYFLQRLSQKARSSQTSERESEFIFHCGDTICICCDLLVSNVISMENVICHKNNSLQNSNFKLKVPLRYIIFLSLLSGIKQESRWILLQDDQQQNQGKETYFILSAANVIRVIFTKFTNLLTGRSSNFLLNLFCHIWSGFSIDPGNSGKTINPITTCEILSINYCLCQSQILYDFSPENLIWIQIESYLIFHSLPLCLKVWIMHGGSPCWSLLGVKRLTL